MIAAETLFLGGADDTNERSGMRYKLGLRAAFFVKLETYSATQILRFMRRAYDARSSIVHGGTEPDAKMLESKDGKQLTLEDLTNEVQDLIRVALKQALPLATGPASGLLMDWDVEMLTPGPAS
jgi:hypothetical protein